VTAEPEKPKLDCREVLEEVYLYLDEECSPCLSEYGIEQVSEIFSEVAERDR